jgi:hypothetical protein
MTEGLARPPLAATPIMRTQAQGWCGLPAPNGTWQEGYGHPTPGSREPRRSDLRLP